ncbi:MAG: 50S ribosomal protein L17 [Verrucomicrobiota bacterium]
MRHRKHRHQLGVTKEHRQALMSNLAAALFRHGRIETTLAKAKALRPFAEKIITLAKKAAATDDVTRKLHYRRIALARVRDKAAIKLLFDERASEFSERTGGYIRIYKLIPRASDGAPMGIVELIDGSDEGYTKPKRNRKPSKKAKTEKVEETEAPAEAVSAEPEASAEAEATAEDAPADENKD